MLGELFTHRPHKPDGSLDEPVAGVFMILDSDTAAVHGALLEAYLVDPPFPRVWAGDDPNNPQWTVCANFPDEATAESVRAAIFGE